MRKTIIAIQRAVRKNLAEVSANATWLRICEEYQLGHQVNQKIYLSEHDRQRLRNIIIQQTSLDPLLDSLEGDRNEIAKITRDEKLSNHSVFANFLQIARHRGLPIPIKMGDGVTPPGTLLSSRLCDLDVTRIEKLLIIENGTTGLGWHHVPLPNECADALIFYRGHGNNLIDLINFRGLLPKCTSVFIYSDFDIAGIRIAMQLKANYVVIPKSWRDIKPGNDFYNRFNKIDVYHTQEPMFPNNLSQDHNNLLPILKHLKDYSIAITQEHMTMHNISLTALPTNLSS